MTFEPVALVRIVVCFETINFGDISQLWHLNRLPHLGRCDIWDHLFMRASSNIWSDTIWLWKPVVKFGLVASLVWVGCSCQLHYFRPFWLHKPIVIWIGCYIWASFVILDHLVTGSSCVIVSCVLWAGTFDTIWWREPVNHLGRLFNVGC